MWWVHFCFDYVLFQSLISFSRKQALSVIKNLAREHQQTDVLAPFEAADAWLKPMRP
jgi:hypothetical protein